MSDLDDFEQARLDVREQELVAVDNEFQRSEYNRAPQERVSKQDIGLWSDVAREWHRGASIAKVRLRP